MPNEFELYRLLVEEVRETRKARRQIANLFVTLNVGGVSALGFLANQKTNLSPALAAWLCGALVLTCVIWWVSNGYFRRLLALKYDVIYDLERRLAIDALQVEWRRLPRLALLRWFGLERAMPFLFVLGYAVFLAHQTTLAELTGYVEGYRLWWTDAWRQVFS